MISSNVPRMLKRMVCACGYSGRMSNNLQTSRRVWHGRNALPMCVNLRRGARGPNGFCPGRDRLIVARHDPIHAKRTDEATRGWSAPVVYDRSIGRARLTRGIKHQLLQETLFLFPLCVEMLDATFD